MARRTGVGEGKPELFEDRCAGGCGRKAKPRVFGTCGRQKCIEKVNEGLRKPSDTGRDPAQGGKVKVNGKWHDVKRSGSNKHGHFVVLKDGHSVSIDEIQAWKD
jgi:hypothetical protein